MAIMAASVVVAGYNVAGVARSNEDDARFQQQLNALNGEYDDLTSAAPASGGVGGTTMRDAVAFYNTAMKNFPAMPAFLARVSQVLKGRDELKLRQVAWIATDNEKAMPALAPAGGRNDGPVKALPKTSDVPSAPASGPAEDPNPPFAGGRYEIALLEGTVRVAKSNYRAAVADVQRLADDIGQIEGFRADVVESPLDVRSSWTLQGRLAERDPESTESRFVLRVLHDRGFGA